MKPCRPTSIFGSAISRLLLLLVSCVICVAQAKTGATCLSYEPSVVKLEGTLVRKTFPGPPNYASVRKGDRPETYWLLNLGRPVCVDPDPRNADLNGPQENVSVVQLVVDPKVYRTHARLIGKRVIATGTLFGAITGHHHTPVLLTVATLVEH